MSRHLDVSCDRCGVVARYTMAQRFWQLGQPDDLCPPCASLTVVEAAAGNVWILRKYDGTRTATIEGVFSVRSAAEELRGALPPDNNRVRYAIESWAVRS